MRWLFVFVCVSSLGGCGGKGSAKNDGGQLLDAMEQAGDRTGSAVDAMDDTATPPDSSVDLSQDSVEADAPIDTSADSKDGSADDGGDASADSNSVFNCISSWPARPPQVKGTPTSAQPRVLWSVPVTTGRIQRVMATTGTGVAFASGYTLIVLDGGGNTVASVAKPQMTGYISSPIADANGDLYFVDSSAAYRVDNTGKQIWRTPLGPNLVGTESVTLDGPVMDPGGRLYVSGLDYNLWVIRSSDGQVVSMSPLGGQRRSLAMGVADVLFMDRSGQTAGGTPASLGLFMPAAGVWAGEVTIGPGRSVPGAIAGFDIGLVAYGWVDTSAEVSDTVVFDSCGRTRWHVPGNYSWPLAISFGDDLIVRDKTPAGGGTYAYAVRRFTRDGVLAAGPVSKTICAAVAEVGSDDTLHFVVQDASGTSVIALDSSLNDIWSVPLGHVGCPTAAVLNSDGKLFIASDQGTQPTLFAVQTTSPGPAPVSWSRTIARDNAGTSWLAP